MKCAFPCKVYCDFLLMNSLDDMSFILKRILLDFKHHNLIFNKFKMHIFHVLYKNILHFIIIRVCCLYVHRHGQHIWQLIVTILFQMQTLYYNHLFSKSSKRWPQIVLYTVILLHKLNIFWNKPTIMYCISILKVFLWYSKSYLPCIRWKSNNTNL